MRILLWSKFITHGFCFIAFLLPSHISSSRKEDQTKKRETFRFAFAVLCVVALFPFPCFFLLLVGQMVQEAGEERNGISFMRNKFYFWWVYLTILAVVPFSLLTLYYGMAFNFILFTGLLLSLLLCAFYKKCEWKDHLDDSGFNVSFLEDSKIPCLSVSLVKEVIYDTAQKHTYLNCLLQGFTL